ncbi:MAG TPA: diguanylate cyclase [Nitrospirota bacterium]
MNKIVIPGLVLYTLSSGLGLFLNPGRSSALLIPWLLGFIFLVFVVSYLALFGKQRSLSFEFLVLGIVGLNFAIQSTGGTTSPLHAAYFLLGAAATFQPLLRAYYGVAIILAIEAGNLLVGQHAAYHWRPYAVFAASLAGMVSVIAPFVGRMRSQARSALDQYQKLLADARAVDPLANDATPASLSDEKRQAANISTAVERENAFNGLISMIYEQVPAHTYALFVAEREEGVFVLRAVRSESRDLAAIGEARIRKGSGLLGISIAKNEPQYLPDTVVAARALGYYTRDLPVKSLLAIPISQGDQVAGVLVVDSLERNAFSPDNQDLLARFAPFFSQLIEKIRISQELDLRAKNFSSLHDMSAVLNSSLEIEQVLDKLSDQIRPVIPYDFCAFLLYDGKKGDAVFAALRGYDAKLIGARFPMEQSAILMRMHKKWSGDEHTVIKYYDPALGDRGRDISLFPFKEMQKPYQSLYGRPLIARNKFVGAVILGSLRTNAFSEYQRSFLETLLNQVAMVVDNSMMHQSILDLARNDGLTGLLNHRTFMEKLAEEYKRIDRESRPFSILLMDIDKFKNVNDTYGHPVGDLAIKAVAQVLRETARTTDFVARYGGEEFTVGMVDTNSKGAEQMAERVRKRMEATIVDRIGGKDLKITLSIGVASLNEDTNNPADLVTMADKALYQATRTGRNRVCGYKAVRNAEAIPTKPGR